MLWIFNTGYIFFTEHKNSLYCFVVRGFYENLLLFLESSNKYNIHSIWATLTIALYLGQFPHVGKACFFSFFPFWLCFKVGKSRLFVIWRETWADRVWFWFSQRPWKTWESSATAFRDLAAGTILEKRPSVPAGWHLRFCVILGEDSAQGCPSSPNKNS